jgi:hypothetical protein
MAMSDDKVAEMFNLPLSTMQEKDHPTLPGVRIGERSEGRHSGLVKEISKILRDTSRKLVEAGFTSLGEVVERAFADVKARPEVEPQEHMAISLLAVAPSLGEVFKVQGAGELHDATRTDVEANGSLLQRLTCMAHCFGCCKICSHCSSDPTALQ